MFKEVPTTRGLVFKMYRVDLKYVRSCHLPQGGNDNKIYYHYRIYTSESLVSRGFDFALWEMS